MIRPAIHSISGISLICYAVGVMAMAVAIPAMAGVSLPPMPDPSDTNAMEQYRINVYYQAQKSEQAKMRVGQQRYERMLTNRSNMVAALASELAEREQLVIIPAKSPIETYQDKQGANSWSGTILGAAVIGLGLIGFRCYLVRLNFKDATSQNQ